MSAFISWFGLGLLVICSLGLLLSRDWRLSLAFTGVLFLGVFLLVRLYWPLGMSAVKLVTGWMGGAVLGMTRLGLANKPETKKDSSPGNLLFRLLSAALAGTVIAAAAPRLNETIPGIGLAESAASLTLVGMGLLHLGTTSEPFRVTLGLLTLMAGFEILYATVEGSVLVAGLLAVINLGLALAGSYFMAAAESAAST